MIPLLTSELYQPSSFSACSIISSIISLQVCSLVIKTCDLTCHDGSVCHIAFLNGFSAGFLSVRYSSSSKDFPSASSSVILSCHLVSQAADRMSVGSSCYRRIDILCFNDSLLVIFMYNGFLGNHKPGSDLNCLCAQHESRRDASCRRRCRLLRSPEWIPHPQPAEPGSWWSASPICPPDSIPSATTASAPYFSIRRRQSHRGNYRDHLNRRQPSTYPCISQDFRLRS